MKLWVAVLFACAASVAPVLAQTPLPPAASRNVDYDADVRPILAQNCYSCHGAEAQQSGLRLDLRQNALRGGRLRTCHHSGQQRGQQADQAARARRWRIADAADRPACRMTRSAFCGRGSIRERSSGPRSDQRRPKARRSEVAAVIAAVRSRDRATLETLIAADPAMAKSKRCGGLDAAASCGRIRHARKPHVPPRQGRRRQREKSARLDAAFLGPPRRGKSSMCLSRAAQRSTSSRSRGALRCIRHRSSAMGCRFLRLLLENGGRSKRGDAQSG